MACTNCFNGCAEIISDKCVKYTGADVPLLGITTGDTLLNVENKITDKILTLMNGTGIIPIIDQAEVCDVVEELMPCCPPFNLNVILNVYLKAICALNVKNEGLKDRIIVLETAVNALNADYIIQCLEDVDVDSDTHDIVQAIIDKLCALVAVQDNYVLASELNGLIAEYLADLPITDKNSAKMLPYIAYPYYGPITAFSGTGVGSGVWEKVYLCNGDNGTPDLRGRTLVGATSMPGIIGMNPIVNPGGSNPAYNVTPGPPATAGANTATLTESQLPLHTHTATFTGAPHNHNVAFRRGENDGGNSGIDLRPKDQGGIDYTATSENTTATGTITVTPSGGSGQPHQNIQPSVAAYYIMYIP